MIPAVSVRSDIARVEQQFRGLQQEAQDKAVVRSLNRMGSAAITEGSRQVRLVYSDLRIKQIKGWFRLQRASKGRKIMTIHPRGGRIPLTFFPVRQTPLGVTVRLGKGKSVSIRHAFIRPRGGLRNAVFIRSTQYNGVLYTHPDFRQKRVKKTGNDLPIAELFAPGIPQVIIQNGIDTTIVRFGKERFSVEYERQLKFYMARALR